MGLRAGVQVQPRWVAHVIRAQGEGDHVRPAHPDEPLDRLADGDAVLGHEEVKRQRLPAIRIDDVSYARKLEDQLRIDGEIAGVVRVAQTQPLVRAIGLAVGDHRGGYPVSERRGRVPLGGGEGLIVAQRIHLGVELRLGGRSVRVTGLAVDVEVAHGEAVLQQPVGGIADRLLPCRLQLLRRLLLPDQIAHRRGSVGRPCVRQVEQVARVRRRFGDVDADCVEQLLVPQPRDAVSGAALPAPSSPERILHFGTDSGDTRGVEPLSLDSAHRGSHRQVQHEQGKNRRRQIELGVHVRNPPGATLRVPPMQVNLPAF